MRHLRLPAAYLAMAAIAVACSSPGANSNGGASQAAVSPGSAASQPAASTGGGGGGGGSGPNGSITYEISGDFTKSGGLAFTYISGGVSLFTQGGWVAYFYSASTPELIMQINSNPASNIVNYGDGEILVIGTEDTGCTFNYSQNDANGLKGTIDCPSPIGTKTATGDQIHVKLHATVDAHT